MHGAGSKKKKKQNTNLNKNAPFGYPLIPTPKNWDADCFPGLGNKPDSPYVGEEL